MQFDYSHALLSLYPNNQWILNGDSYEGLQWKDVTIPKPSQDTLDTELDRLRTEYTSKQYQRDRAKIYPTIQDQLDLLYWDKVNGTNNWQTAIQAIKDKYPKL